MHRETLSRSLFYSHNLMGKAVVSVSCSRHLSLRSRQALAVPTNSRLYHRSFEKTAQPVTHTAVAKELAETIAAEPTASQEKEGVPKKFNIRATELFSGEEDSVLPPPSSSDGEDVEDINFSSSNTSLLETRILEAVSPEELLVLSNQPRMTLRHACLLIWRLGYFTSLRPQEQLQKLKQDTRFVRVCNLIQRGNHSQSPHALLLALTGLQKLGLEKSDDVTRLLERELSWSMRRCPLKFLAKSIRILNDNAATATNNKQSKSTGNDPDVIDTAVKVLQRRWIEAITGSDFISLFQIVDLLDDEKKLKLEERAADMANQFHPTEMKKIFIILGMRKRRPTPLLRALSFHYCKSGYKINAREGIEFIYALNELTFAEPILMSRLCSDIAPEIPSITNVALISSLLTSLGQMRYKQNDILIAVDEWVTKHVSDLRVFDFAAWLQAAATLNHHSPNLETFCKKAAQVLTQATVTSPLEWVNIVHSFVVLNHHQNEMLASVLQPSFLESIESLGPRSTRHKLKILNINYFASQFKGRGYTGPVLPDDKVKDWTSAVVSTSDNQFSKLVTDSLASFLPPSKYLELNSKLPCGVYVDGICHVDNKATPVTIADATSKTAVPTQRVAFVVEGYAGMCLGLKQRTGQSALINRILESQNFIVITVPYTEFGYTDKLVRRVQYLEQKLKAISDSSELKNG